MKKAVPLNRQTSVNLSRITNNNYRNAKLILAFLMLAFISPANAQYCVSKSNAPWELWIQNVRLNSINYISGKYKEYSSLGYSDFTNINTTLKKGMTYELSTEVGVSWQGILNNTHCRTWIDWNRNNVFENTELVFQNTNVSNFTSALRVPTTAQTGTTRMRIAVKMGDFPTPCETFGAGEVEDYTVTIVEPTQEATPVCSNTLGSGEVLCYDNSNTDAIVLYLAEGNSIVQKKLDKKGTQLSSTNVGSLLKDSILVVNKQVIKKLANGTIAYTKNITPSVLNRFPSINTALEMSDGTFVLAGYQKYIDPIFPSNNADSLVLVVTDANLTYQNSFVEERGGGPYTIYYDAVLQLIPFGANRFVMAHYKGFSRLVTGSNLLFTSFRKDNNGLLVRLNKGEYGYGLKNRPIITEFCGNNLIVQSDVTSYAQKGLFRGIGSSVFNLDSMRHLAVKTVGTGNADYYGDYKTYSYTYNPYLTSNKFQLSANYSGTDPRINFNTFQALDISFYDNEGVLTFKKTIPFIAFDHIIRTGDTSCLVLASSNGQLSIINPDCNNTPSTLPDLTVSNLTVSTPSVQQRGVLFFKFDAKNTGTSNVSNNFTIKSYLSKDNILDAQDYRDGIIATGNYATGANISQIQGAMTVGAAVDTGNYYLILKIDADNQITESNESNNTTFTQVRVGSDVVTTGGGNGTNDIALSLISTPSVYRQYTKQNFKISAKNNSNQAFTDVKIDFPFPAKTVSGGTMTPSVGTWQEWCSGGTRCYTWVIPNLAANTTATLELPIYVLDAVGLLSATTRLLSSNPTDNTTINNSVTILVGAANAPLIEPLSRLKSNKFAGINQQIRPTIADNDIVLELESNNPQSIDCQVINSLGTVVLTKQLMLERGRNAFNFSVGQLPKGMYFVQTGMGNKVMKFVKL
ncbi:MAG: GEVED domain-containing protein [Saprospiraceae bacterium]|nr:GEVED domain-containing protein [Saprospiraceae bacterium]